MLSEWQKATRRLIGSPTATIVSVICLSIGVWMACVVNAVVGGTFTPRIRVYAPERLVFIDEIGLFTTVTQDRLRFVRQTSTQVIDSLAARRVFSAIGYYVAPTVTQIAPERGGRLLVRMSSGMMDVLGLRVTVGRRFTAVDDSAAGLLISNRLWRTMFGGDSTAVGRTLRLMRWAEPIPIVGVVEDGFDFPTAQRVDLYLSAGSPPARGSRPVRGNPHRIGLARLRDGQSVEDVEPIVRGIATRSVRADREAMEKLLRAEYAPKTPPSLTGGPVNVRVGR
jgi:hypothetical protein